MQIIFGQDLGKLLIERGIIPHNTRRFVIDCEVNKPAVLFVEQYGDESLLDVFTRASLEVRVMQEPPREPEPEYIAGTKIPVPRTHTPGAG